MDYQKTFRTKTGFCHIQPDKIILTRDGIIGNVAKTTVGNNITRILTIYAILAVALIYFAFYSFQRGQIIQTIFVGLIGLYLIYGILRSLNNSTIPIINRDKIKEVKLKKAIPGLTRSRFEVFFEDINGKVKKRMIMLPGSMSGGQNETKKAIQIMTREKLL